MMQDGVARHDGKDAQKGEEVERPDTETTAKNEAADGDGSILPELLPELAADEEAAKHEEEVDTAPAVCHERQSRECVRAVGIGEGGIEVVVHDEQDGESSQAVEEGELIRRGMDQLRERTAEEVREAAPGRWPESGGELFNNGWIFGEQTHRPVGRQSECETRS